MTIVKSAADKISQVSLKYFILPLLLACVQSVFVPSPAIAGGGKLPQLAVTKTCTPNPKPGDIITCDISVRNTVKYDYWDVSIVDVVPAHLIYQQDGTSGECQLHGNQPKCWIKQLKGYATKNLWIKFKLSPTAPCGQQIVNQIDVAAKHAPTNWAKAMFTPSCDKPSEFEIIKTGPPQIWPGETITYTIVATNKGSSVINSATVNDVIPAGLTYNPAGSTQGCVQNPGQAHITCPTFNYAPGESRTFIVSFFVPATIACGSVIVNQADIHSQNAPPNWAKFMTQVLCHKPICKDGIDNDGDGWIDMDDPCCLTPEGTDEANCKPTMDITKSGPATIWQDEVATYTIVATNNSNIMVKEATVNDVLPGTTGLIFVPGGSTPGCEQRAGQNYVTCQTYNYAPGESRTFVVQYRFPSTIACDTVIVNQADVHSKNAPSNWAKSMTQVLCKKPPVLPYLECVYCLGNGQYRAYFGYDNTGPTPITIPAGTNTGSVINAFTPDPKDRGQSSTFNPGRAVSAFSVIFDGNPIEWTIKPENAVANKITASKDSVACKPVEPVAECVDKKSGNKCEAKFGYKNANPFEIKIDIGENNKFIPAPEDRGQPNGFFSGNNVSAFQVAYQCTDLTWKLATKETVAKDGVLPRCTPNKPPTCNAGAAAYSAQCTGDQTKIFLDGSGSSDTDGQPLTYKWTTDCVGGTISDPNIAQPVLTLDTSTGVAISCKVSLVVDDEVEQSSCSQTVAVTACSKDCKGTVNGTAVVDQCGVCGGDGTSCEDCAGVPNGNAKVDKCGVCGGNDACVDCAGVVNGTAKVDRCGVCNGDGSSCTGCTTSDITDILMSLDSGALAQKNLVHNSSKRLQKLNVNAATNKLAVDADKEAQALYVEAWNNTWTIPRIINNCTNATICTESDNSVYINAYNTNSIELRDVALTLARAFKNLERKNYPGVSPNQSTRISQRANELNDQNLAISATVPRFTSTCQ